MSRVSVDGQKNRKQVLTSRYPAGFLVWLAAIALLVTYQCRMQNSQSVCINGLPYLEMESSSETSVDNPICKYGTQSFKPTPLICIEKKPLKQAWVCFLSKQEKLRDTGRLHALIHIFVPRSDGKAKLSDSISRYRRPFMQTDGLICVLHAKNRKCYGG